MHLVISLLNFRQGAIGGTETYLRKLIPAMVDLRGADRMTLLSNRDNAGEIAHPELGEVVLPWGHREITRMRVLEAFTPFRARKVEREIAALGPDICFFPQQSIFPKYAPGPAVLTVHDFQHLAIPRNFSWADRLFRAAIYPFSLRRAKRIITVSDFTRHDLLRRYNVAPEGVSTARLGFDAPGELGDISLPEIPTPYIYYPAASHVHKNHLQLLQSVSQLRERGKFDYSLVFSGIQTSYWNTLARHIKALGLRDVVHHVGYVSYAIVQGLYRSAEAVVFPTNYEGFGLPVMEAVSWRKKVIVSRLEVFDELGVPREFQIDFGDPAQLAAAMALPGITCLTRHPNSWPETAATTWSVLRAGV